MAGYVVFDFSSSHHTPPPRREERKRKKTDREREEEEVPFLAFLWFSAMGRSPKKIIFKLKVLPL